MKRIIHSIIGASILACTPCSSPASPTPPTFDPPEFDIPLVQRPYDTVRGGLQITAIYYDQTKNRKLTGMEDEWIVLQSDYPVATRGWTLNAGDRSQNYYLPDTVHCTLTLYTHYGPGYENDTVQTLKHSGSKWIWNNTDPDTARIYNANNELVDIFTYTVKR